MKVGWLNGEIDLEELLEDEVMTSAVKSAGLSPSEFRRQLTATARRVAGPRRPAGSGYRASFWELRAVR